MNEIPRITEIIQMDLEELTKVQNRLNRVNFFLQRARKDVSTQIFTKKCEARGGITLDDVADLLQFKTLPF